MELRLRNWSNWQTPESRDVTSLCQCQSKIFNVARIAELLQSPWRHSRVKELGQEKTDEKGIFWDADTRRAETGMIGCQMAMSSRGVMQRLEMCVDQRLWARMVEQAVDVMMTICQFHIQDGSAVTIAHDDSSACCWSYCIQCSDLSYHANIARIAHYQVVTYTAVNTHVRHACRIMCKVLALK